MSPRYRLTGDDLARWVHNLGLFAAPLALMYVVYVTNNVQTLGFSANAFVPTLQVQGALALYVLNGVIDILKKWISFNNYS